MDVPDSFTAASSSLAKTSRSAFRKPGLSSAYVLSMLSSCMYEDAVKPTALSSASAADLVAWSAERVAFILSDSPEADIVPSVVNDPFVGVAPI